MAFFLGIDAGGTKTVCAIGDETRILARAQGGSIKHMRVGKEQAGENLRAVVGEALQAAGVRADQIASSCVGTAGSRIPSFAAWVMQSLEELVSGKVEVCGDDEVALDAAFPGGAGVLVVAGTGSNIAGRTSTGALVNAGGWGPALGDEGSGYWIGHTALCAAFRAYDWGEPTMLLERVTAFWSLPELGEVVAYANKIPAPDFSRLTPLVVECAEAGDAVATQTLLDAGRYLAEFALLACRKVRHAEPDGPIPGFAFTGSVLANISMVRETMTEQIRRALPAAHIAQEPVDPLEGALWRARHAVGAAAAIMH
ncbi:MAG TPA: BadF/BadG/BcrA/BcrD ATPase family protein [Acidisarcina sp.]|nr:BadF/BadG/BcrA/BcrD ATPase family protein [Acidisarcina sp.]